MTQSQIEQDFKGIEGINEAKKIYKELAKKLHPDIGGSTELFKILNQVYNQILESGTNFLNDQEFDLEIEKIISQILHYENIIIEVVGSWIWLQGDTKPIKDKLKELGFKCKKRTKRATNRVFIRPPLSLDIRPPMTELIQPLCAPVREFIFT